MTPKTLIHSTRVLSDHRYDLSYDVNTRIAKFVEECNNANAKVTVDMGEERPIGPFGQWCQTVTYTVQGDYDDPALAKLYDSYTPKSAKPNTSATQNSSNSTSSGGCYVATAVYGSYDCPQVWTLRRYRDDILSSTWHGRAFIHIYYAISPTLVKWFGDKNWFKKLWKNKLDNMVRDLNNIGIEDTPYHDKAW